MAPVGLGAIKADRLRDSLLFLLLRCSPKAAANFADNGAYRSAMVVPLSVVRGIVPRSPTAHAVFASTFRLKRSMRQFNARITINSHSPK